MPPKRSKDGTTSLVKFWLKQQQEEEELKKTKAAPQSTATGVITVADSPPTDNPTETNDIHWSVFYGNRRRSNSVVSQPTALTNYSSEKQMLEWGADVHQCGIFQYLISEYPRQFEIQSAMRCVAQNTCISLPDGASPVNIFALASINFLRLFPHSKAVHCCNSLLAAEDFSSACQNNGIPISQISIVPTFQEFKKIKEHTVGKIIISTPQAIQKWFESESDICADVRCLSVSLDAGETSTKAKKLVAGLTIKGVPFRILLGQPSIPDNSKRSAPIAKRQQMITSLHITSWLEPESDDEQYRFSYVPTVMAIEYWSSTENPAITMEMTAKWRTGTDSYLEKVRSSLNLPKGGTDDLFHYDFTSYIQKEAKLIVFFENLMFLMNCYRMLVLYGPRAFFLHCAEVFNKSSERCERLQLLILGQSELSAVTEWSQANFGHNKEGIIDDASLNEKSLKSHMKLEKLRKVVEQYMRRAGDRRQRGMILCSNQTAARVAAEALCSLSGIDVRLVVASGVVNVGDKRILPIDRISRVFYEATNTVVVLSLDLPSSLSALDSATSNGVDFVVAFDRSSVCLLENHGGEYMALLHEQFEKLRNTDGRHMTNESCVDEGLFSRRTSRGGRFGAVDRYDFKFEPSLIRLNENSFVRQGVTLLIEESKQQSQQTRSMGFELTSHEYAQYVQRLGDCLPPEIPVKKKRTLCVLDRCSEPQVLDDDELICNEHVQYYGNLSCGTLTRRLVEYMMDGTMENKHQKRKYVYSDHLVSQQEIHRYQKIIDTLHKIEFTYVMNRRSYRSSDEERMVAFVAKEIRNGQQQKGIKGLPIWLKYKNIYKDEHSPQSLLTHYRRHIEPNFESINCDKADLELIKRTLVIKKTPERNNRGSPMKSSPASSSSSNDDNKYSISASKSSSSTDSGKTSINVNTPEPKRPKIEIASDAQPLNDSFLNEEEQVGAAESLQDKAVTAFIDTIKPVIKQSMNWIFRYNQPLRPKGGDWEESHAKELGKCLAKSLVHNVHKAASRLNDTERAILNEGNNEENKVEHLSSRMREEFSGGGDNTEINAGNAMNFGNEGRTPKSKRVRLGKDADVDSENNSNKSIDFSYGPCVNEEWNLTPGQVVKKNNMKSMYDMNNCDNGDILNQRVEEEENDDLVMESVEQASCPSAACGPSAAHVEESSVGANQNEDAQVANKSPMTAAGPDAIIDTESVVDVEICGTKTPGPAPQVEIVDVQSTYIVNRYVKQEEIEDEQGENVITEKDATVDEQLHDDSDIEQDIFESATKEVQTDKTAGEVDAQSHTDFEKEPDKAERTSIDNTFAQVNALIANNEMDDSSTEHTQQPFFLDISLSQ